MTTSVVWPRPFSKNAFDECDEKFAEMTSTVTSKLNPNNSSHPLQIANVLWKSGNVAFKNANRIYDHTLFVKFICAPGQCDKFCHNSFPFFG